MRYKNLFVAIATIGGALAGPFALAQEFRSAFQKELQLKQLDKIRQLPLQIRDGVPVLVQQGMPGKPPEASDMIDRVTVGWRKDINMLPIDGGSPLPTIEGHKKIWVLREKIKPGPISVTSGSAEERDCDKAAAALAPDPGTAPVLQDSSTKRITPKAREYFQKCFRKFEQLQDSQVREHFANHVGLLRRPSDNAYICPINFVTAQRAVTAGHCLLGSDPSKLKVSGLHPDGSAWTAGGVVMLVNGSEGAIPDARKVKGGTDYVTIGPVAGTSWPVNPGPKQPMWGPHSKSAVAGLVLSTATWMDSNDLAGQPGEGAPALLIDSQLSCMAGTYDPTEVTFPHRCQGVQGTSGSALTGLRYDANGRLAPIIIGIHLGSASWHNLTDSDSYANAGLVVPVEAL